MLWERACVRATQPQHAVRISTNPRENAEGSLGARCRDAIATGAMFAASEWHPLSIVGNQQPAAIAPADHTARRRCLIAEETHVRQHNRPLGLAAAHSCRVRRTSRN